MTTFQFSCIKSMTLLILTHQYSLGNSWKESQAILQSSVSNYRKQKQWLIRLIAFVIWIQCFKIGHENSSKVTIVRFLILFSKFLSCCFFSIMCQIFFIQVWFYRYERLELHYCVCVIKILFNLNSLGSEKFQLFSQGTYESQNLENETLFIVGHQNLKKSAFHFWLQNHA